MTPDAFNGGAAPAQHARDFFLARQPILNRQQHLVAYELLFRDAASGAANVVDHVAATATVMAHVAELGLDNVVGESLGFVNIDAAVLMSDFIGFLPADKVVLEILETVKVTPAIIARIKELSEAGYQFALDDVVVKSEDVRQLLPLAHVIKVDILGVQPDALRSLVFQLKQGGKKLLAEKVETIAEFETCLDLGFDYFQGYYFAKPLILSGKKLAPSQLAIVQLMNQIVADEDSTVLEHTIKHDVSLSLNLLRLVNSVGISGGRHIESVGQALIVLGRVQLQRWLQILLYAGAGQGDGLKSPLLALATARGKLLELMTLKRYPDHRSLSEKSFTVGIMSLMDVLFGLPMEAVLGQLTVAQEVHDALLFRRGELGDMLKLAEYIERIEQAWPLLLPVMRKLGLSAEDVAELQVHAFRWSNSIADASA
ncbi:EAL domain-containing protein [Janthinobacterium sp. 17J80-10]|uniref:EAL and HDOD domain-containing protein n=1 Tax=Janthinobacterium sp. 17J80-10 TaxID=2497863 RepID=UPI0010053170|nr:EAL domain-containing protein [Janthinobacterium sp. 17J80-10]QAU35008.1 EAL domain-containing protein [Janthinobacterium sp. 17J80-10]